MSARINASRAALFILLCTCTAMGHKLRRKTIYSAMLHEMITVDADAGADLEDAKMTNLTDSIQGVFDMSPITKPSAGENGTAQPAKSLLAGKPGHIHAVLVNQSQQKENKTKVIEDAAVSMPMASFALDKRPKFIKNTTEDNSVENATQKVAWEKKEQFLGKEIKSLRARLANASTSVESSRKGHDVTLGKLPTKGKVGHINVSSVAHPQVRTIDPSNQTQVSGNKTKAIEEATVSLPMASFALDVPKPAKNKTVPKKFPGNASQKAAFEKKEQSLEKQVSMLKDRLANASESMASNGHHKKPVASDTSKAQVYDADGRQVSGFMAVNAPEKQQLISVSKVAMGSIFTSPAPKKVESVIALDASVQHEAMPSDSVARWPVGDWLSSAYSWLVGSPPSKVTSEMPVASQVVETPRQVGSLLWVKQDSERTAQATQAEHQHSVELTDVWSQMEDADATKEENVRREDLAARQRAETPELPHKPTKSELEGRHGVEMSDFWNKLEKEDYRIEKTVQSDDLVKTAELTQDQDKQISKANSELYANQLTGQVHPSHNTDARLAIHEPWLRRQARDEALERQVHESPDLQMLQLQHRHVQRK